MELIKDYDMRLHYHPGKANVVADALSRKSYANTLVSTGLPKELAAIVHTLKTWRYFLIGNRCDVYTDHKSFKYIFMQKELNLKQRRWLELIKDYDMRLHYHPGKANIVADALSRKSHVNTLIRRITSGVSRGSSRALLGDSYKRLCCSIGNSVHFVG